MIKKNSVLVVILATFFFAIFIVSNQNVIPAEKIEVVSGAGIDVINDEKGAKIYQVSLSVYTFKQKEIVGSMIRVGSAINLPRTREARQLQSEAKYISAIQKIIVFSEAAASQGIGNELDILFANPLSNAMSWNVICKGMAIDLLSKKVESYPSSADVISEIVDSSTNYNFFSDNYKMIDMFVRVDAEGRGLVLPYIEVVKDQIEITGMALFNKDKMIAKIDMDDAKIMNMLRENSARGLLSVQKNFKDYASSYCNSKRKVTCEKVNDRYQFTINLDIKGELISNTLFEGMEEDTKIIQQYEKQLEEETQEKCMDFINKMKYKYEIDCLELGKVACAKFGRKTGVDWNEVVSDAIIDVNVNVDLIRFGKGRYAIKE